MKDDYYSEECQNCMYWAGLDEGIRGICNQDKDQSLIVGRHESCEEHLPIMLNLDKHLETKNGISKEDS